jgi:hypothetical protein
VPSAKNRTPSLTGGRLEIVKLTIVPSVSVAASGSIVVAAAALEGMLALVTSVATGGWLVNGIVNAAGVASTALLLSVAVKVNVTLPTNVPLGSNFRLEACAGVSTCPSVTAVVPSAKNKMPCAAGGRLETV